MRKHFNQLFMLAIIFTTLLFSYNCKKDEPAAKPPGNLQILVCDQSQTTYFGGAEVFLYKSGSDRTNDVNRTNYFRKTTTDNSAPETIGAVFYDLPVQVYYAFGRRDLGGGNFISGTGDYSVTSGQTTPFMLIVQ